MWCVEVKDSSLQWPCFWVILRAAFLQLWPHLLINNQPETCLFVVVAVVVIVPSESRSGATQTINNLQQNMQNTGSSIKSTSRWRHSQQTLRSYLCNHYREIVRFSCYYSYRANSAMKNLNK